MHYFLVTGSNGPEIVQAHTGNDAIKAYKKNHGEDSWVTSCTWERK